MALACCGCNAVIEGLGEPKISGVTLGKTRQGVGLVRDQVDALADG